MAVATPTSLTTGTKTTDSTSATTASVTPTANRLYFLTVMSKTEITADPNQPTVTGAGLTWVNISTLLPDADSSSRRRATLFRALGASPSSGALTIDFGGQTQVTSGWVLDEIASGHDTTGTNGSGAVVQVATAVNTDLDSTKTSLTATLAAFGNANNATYGSTGVGNGNTTTISVGSGFTQISAVKDTVETNLQLMTQFKSTNDTTVDFNYSPAEAEIAIFAVEIKASTASDGIRLWRSLLGVGN